MTLFVNFEGRIAFKRTQMTLFARNGSKTHELV